MAQYAIFAAGLTGVMAAAVAGFATADKIAGPAMLWYDVVAVVFGVRACRHPGLDRSLRPAARLLLAVAVGTLGITGVFIVTGTAAFPQAGDILHVIVVALLFVALLRMPLRRATERERLKTLLDSATVVLGASMLLWFLVIGPSLDTHRASMGVIVAAACYPVVDLLALFALARVLLRGAATVPRQAIAAYGMAVLVLLVGDSYIGWQQAREAVVERSTLAFLCWLTTHFLFTCGTITLFHHAAGRDPGAAEIGAQRGMAGKLPYLGVAIGYLLLATAAVRERDLFPWAGLVAGAMAITGLVVLRQILTQSETAEAAATDGLTGLANRTRLHEQLETTLHRAARSGRTVAVLLIDLNGFKQINDTMGHQAGDDLLVAVASAMRSSVRRDDLVGRLGGDEFAVVLQPDAGAEEASAIAQRITEAIAGPFIIGDLPMSARASIGVAVSETGEHTAGGLLHRADVAMYHRKRQGPGWQVWEPGLGVSDEFETALAAAPGAGQLRLTYRPVRSPAGVVIGSEASLTWEHPSRGTLASEDFLPVAQRIGAAERIGHWVLDQAIRDTTDRYVVVPVTEEQMRRPHFAAEVGDALAAGGLDPRLLVLDVPDNNLLADPGPATQLSGLRALGVRVAVRDFGTGYGSLQALAHQPVDLLRVSGDLPGGDLAEAVLRLSQVLGLSTLIAGVEVPAEEGASRYTVPASGPASSSGSTGDRQSPPWPPT